jgi:hypothetical protein
MININELQLCQMHAVVPFSNSHNSTGQQVTQDELVTHRTWQTLNKHLPRVCSTTTTIGAQPLVDARGRQEVRSAEVQLATGLKRTSLMITVMCISRIE